MPDYKTYRAKYTTKMPGFARLAISASSLVEVQVTTLLPSSDSTKQPSGVCAARFLKYYLNPAVLIGNEPPAGNDSEFTLR